MEKGNSKFQGYHPWVNLCYFALVLGILMCSNGPFFFVPAFICGLVFSAFLKGRKAWKENLCLLLFLLPVMAGINGLFSHNGATVLFYLNGNRITAEAFLYGAVMALLIGSLFIWFGCFSVIMDSEKFIYLFGRILPRLGLLLSMTLRWIPLLRRRFSEIRAGQKGLGKGLAGENLFHRVKTFFRACSVLIAWSLEYSIETADSMEARGYGLGGRSAFHLYRFRKRDGIFLVGTALCGALAIWGCIRGVSKMYYYPTPLWQWPRGVDYVAIVAFCVLLCLPMFIGKEGTEYEGH